MPENFKLLDPCLQLALRHQLLEENLKILSMKKIISPSVFQKYIDIVKPNLDFFKIDDPNDWKNLEAKNMLQKIETDFQESPKKGRKP